MGNRDDTVNLGPHTCTGRRELKECRRDSLKDDKKVDTYRNKENIYGRRAIFEGKVVLPGLARVRVWAEIGSERVQPESARCLARDFVKPDRSREELAETRP
jgi:hypothetical protein